MLVAATEAERENERDSRRVPRWSSPDAGIDKLTVYELMNEGGDRPNANETTNLHLAISS